MNIDTASAKNIYAADGKTRACLKNAFREMCFTLGGEFIPNL